MFSPSWLLTTGLVFLGVLLTIRLGFWQLDRMDQKEEFNSHILSVQSMPELDLSGELNGIDLTTLEYRNATATGYFDFEHQVAVRNQVWTQPWGNEIGFTLLTPLIMENGKGVLVQRGWIPLVNDSPDSWRTFDQTVDDSIHGIIRLSLEKGEMGGGVPDPTLSPGQSGLFFWNYINIDRIQQQLPYQVLPVYIQQAPESNENELPYKSIPTLELTDGAHLGYALQWFFYALLLIVGYPYYIQKHLDK